jgi:diguanylate cyclase (GGDEF)-like protein
MSDTDSPHDNPEPNGAENIPRDGSANGSPAAAGGGSDAPTPVVGGAGASSPAAPAPPEAQAPEPADTARRGRRLGWVAAAVVCVAAGVAASVLGSRAVARNDAAEARQAFPRTAASIASTLKLGLQHEEDLIIGGGTFFANNPTATAAEFSTWVKWSRALRRYPELQRLGLVALVRSAELPAFQARLSGHVLTATVPSSAAAIAAATRALRLSPASTRSYYCLPAVELTRGSAARGSARDYCSQTPGLISSRDSATSTYVASSAGHARALAILTPVYRGSQPPRGFLGRRAAFVGWLHEVLVPGTILTQALGGHSGYAARLRFKGDSTVLAFDAGAAASGAQSSTANLHNGWSVRTFGPAPAGADVPGDGSALALLITGCVLSVLLGLLVLLLGRGGGASGDRVRTPVSVPPQPPREELYDALTGLPNRALMLDRAERMLARATRQSGLLVGALFIDIDWFKDVNEKLGQEAGDQLLKIVAERLENVVRAHDTVGRLGGDEFVVLVESAARGVRLDSLARRVIESLHKPVELDGFGPSFSLTASIGVAFGRYASPDDLLRDAQLALTAAKAAGRDRYTLFNANMRSVIEGRGVLEVELNTALADKQFFLLYEPIYDLATRKVVGLEALVRWRHPTNGVLLPDDFLPLAEESGLIVPIGRWALEEAASRAAAWNVAGHRAGVSVKVSSNQLNRDGFATDVQRALQQSGIEPSLLTLEIAESTVMRDVTASAQRLHEIKQLGVRIAIEDFGSGYAHHADLQRMPLDFLKVDRGSLGASEDEEYRSWLLQAVLIVGRDLSLPVIATGIESREQVAALQSMGCPMAQGPCMGQPAPTNAVDGLFDGVMQAQSAPSSELFQ